MRLSNQPEVTQTVRAGSGLGTQVWLTLWFSWKPYFFSQKTFQGCPTLSDCFSSHRNYY